jgi:two-component system CheB/CheR fusion protein
VTAAASHASGTGEPGGLDSLLEYLKRSRGFDFTGYKRTSLARRIRKRMHEVEVEDYGDYQDHLEVAPGEFGALFDSILINVTSFFRDKPAWDYVAEEVIPHVLEEVPDPHPIRVWSAACASGEEAYTIAMLLAEALGEEAFGRRVKIYATDIDHDALSRARHATYTRDDVQALPEGYVARYFEHGPLGYTFRPDLRRSLIFGRNDLGHDSPISRIDLLVCRNTLMYFIPEAQSRILGHFNFALRDTGFLFLGKAEMLITHTDLFTPHNLRWRVFRKVPRIGLRDRLAFLTDDAAADAERVERYAELRAGALDVAPAAMLVVDRSGFVTSVNRGARTMFGVGASDVGRPFQDLELSYRPVDLRSALERAYSTRAPVILDRTSWTDESGETGTLEVAVTPVPGGGAQALGAVISFHDVTDIARLDDEYERSQRQLETAYEELQSTVEELETTNEELHSTNEELETTNEELQSSNEELETMNEELQSTNDELEVMNDEQSVRGAELDRVNMFLEGILGNLGVGVVVLDEDGRVQVWNANSSELWGVRADEAQGRRFLELDIGFPVERLREPIRQALGDGRESSEHVIEAVTRRGRTVETRVRTLPLRTAEGAAYGTIVLMTLDDRTPMGP